MEKETKTAEEQLIRDLIDKYMNFKTGAESTSIQHYGEYGAVSGSLFLNVKAMMREFANHRLTHQQEINAQLKKQNAELVEKLDAQKEIYQHVIKCQSCISALVAKTNLCDYHLKLCTKLINTPPKN